MVAALHDDSDDELDNAHLMRMAGRFSRRVRAWAKAAGVPVIDCKSGDRKHLIAEEYLATHPVGPGCSWSWSPGRRPRPGTCSAPATVIRNLAKKKAFVNHYSFHILDPAWGHVTIKMAGHPPFGAQVILNGHEHVACAAQAAGIAFAKEGNCFTAAAHLADLAQVADTLSHPATAGRLGQVCDRWIYTACLCFGLDVVDQERSRFRYSYSIYQVEYSRNLLFRSGAQMDTVFNTVIDRTRRRLDIPTLRTLFGAKQRPRTNRADLSPRLAAVIETPQYGLTIFKVHFGALTLKGYTKGEHVLRFEAVCHNTKALDVGRVLDRFGDIVARLAGMLERFCTTVDCVDVAFIPDGILDQLPQPSMIGHTRVGGLDLNNPRTRTALAAVVALAATPGGFTVADLTTKVHAINGHDHYSARQAAYDLRKLRGHNLVTKPRRGRRYHLPPQAARTITALLALREHVIAPIIAGVRPPLRDANPPTGQPSTATTKQSALTCKTSSNTSPSPPKPHRQQIVDQTRQAPRPLPCAGRGPTWRATLNGSRERGGKGPR